MKKFITQIIISVFALSFANAFSQEADNTPFTSSSVLRNPATAGIMGEDINLRVFASLFNQYPSFTSINKPIKDIYLGMEYAIQSEQMGLAADISRVSATSGGMSTSAFMLSYAYNISFSGTHNVSMGLRAGMVQKNFDPSQLKFDSQYSSGIGFDPSIGNGENFSSNALFYPDFNIGVQYLFRSSESFNAWLGLSSSHIAEPNESFSDITKSKLPRIYHVETGTEVNFGQYSTEVIIHYMRQANINYVSAGGLFGYALNKDSKILIGPVYKHNYAIAVLAGMKFSNYKAYCSYDINISGNKVGGFKLSFIYEK